MAYPRELIDDLLKASDIVSVIGSYINVIQKGRSFLAICPFHNDTNPSLNISREKQIYKCFSCGEGGNALTFVQKYEKISFDEAVRKLAEIVGFHDPRLLEKRPERHVNPDLVPLYKCINDLQAYYKYGLGTEEGKIAKAYLNERHIDEKEIGTFGLGYAMSDGQKTIQFLQAKGHSLRSIEGIGIAMARATGTSDSNAGRLIFPLFDHEGQVVGFSARRLKDDKSAKYVNSPETRIFQKSKVLYNYNVAKATAHHDGYIYILEGFMDVMALAKAGISSAVAVMGTNLSDDHIKMLRRLNCELRLCLDGDAAGQEGMMRMLNKLSKSGLSFRVVSNPGDLRDPDDILQQDGPEALVAAMNHLVDPFEFRLNYYTNVRPLETVEDRRKVFRSFVPYIAGIPAGPERETCIDKLAKATQFSARAISDRVLQYEGEKVGKEEAVDAVLHSHSSKRSAKVDPERRKLDNAERCVLYYMLQDIDAVHYFQEAIDSFYDDIYQAAANYILAYVASRNASVELNLLIADIAGSGAENAEAVEQLIQELDDKKNRTIYPPYSREEIGACAKRIAEARREIYHNKQKQDVMLTGDDAEKLRFIAERIKERQRQSAKKGDDNGQESHRTEDDQENR